MPYWVKDIFKLLYKASLNIYPVTCELWSFPSWLVGTCDIFGPMWALVPLVFWGQFFLSPQVVFFICILGRSLVFRLLAFSPLCFQWIQPVLASPVFQLYLFNSGRLMNFTWIYSAWIATWKTRQAISWGSCRAHLIYFMCLRDLYPTLLDIQCL